MRAHALSLNEAGLRAMVEATRQWKMSDLLMYPRRGPDTASERPASDPSTWDINQRVDWATVLWFGFRPEVAGQLAPEKGEQPRAVLVPARDVADFLYSGYFGVTIGMTEIVWK